MEVGGVWVQDSVGSNHVGKKQTILLQPVMNDLTRPKGHSYKQTKSPLKPARNKP